MNTNTALQVTAQSFQKLVIYIYTSTLTEVEASSECNIILSLCVCVLGGGSRVVKDEKQGSIRMMLIKDS